VRSVAELPLLSPPGDGDGSDETLSAGRRTLVITLSRLCFYPRTSSPHA